MAGIDARVLVIDNPRIVIKVVSSQLKRFSTNVRLVEREVLAFSDDGYFAADWDLVGYDTTLVRNISAELYEIEGVDRVYFDQHSVYVEKGEAFDWTGITPRSLQTLAELVFMTELKRIAVAYKTLPEKERDCIRQYLERIR